MLRRAMRDVGDRAVRGVVVGILARRAPLHVHAGLGLHLHPRGPHLVGHDAAEVARAFAHLVGQMRVRRAERDAHPTGIVLALRVRTLHRETKAVGMI